LGIDLINNIIKTLFLPVNIIVHRTDFILNNGNDIKSYILTDISMRIRPITTRS